MGALSAARTQHQSGYAVHPVILSLPQKGSTTIYAGALVVLDAGYLAPGSTATGKLVVGMAEETSVNSGADGAVNVRVRMGVFRWDLESGDEVAQANVGGLCYIKDDHTVSKTATGKSIAGYVLATDGSTYADVLSYIGVK